MGPIQFEKEYLLIVISGHVEAFRPTNLCQRKRWPLSQKKEMGIVGHIPQGNTFNIIPLSGMPYLFYYTDKATALKENPSLTSRCPPYVIIEAIQIISGLGRRR